MRIVSFVEANAPYGIVIRAHIPYYDKIKNHVFTMPPYGPYDRAMFGVIHAKDIARYVNLGDEETVPPGLKPVAPLKKILDLVQEQKDGAISTVPLSNRRRN